jgi:hypothetical protein
VRFSLAVLCLSVWLLASSACASTVFTVQGDLNKEGAELTGTVTIDTIAGTLDAVDLTVQPVTFGQFGFTTMHYTSAGLGHPSGRTFIGSTIIGGWANAHLELTLDVPTLVGYSGGPIKPTETVLNFWSGLYVKSTVETSQERYYSLTSGSLSPLVVPEPSSIMLAAMGLVGIALWGPRPNGIDPATRAAWGSIAILLFWLCGLLIRSFRGARS